VGAWGTGPFQNDQATDFVLDLRDLGTAGAVAAAIDGALNAVTTASGYIHVPEMDAAVAAAALVGRIAGGPDPGSAAVTELLGALTLDAPPTLRLSALAALERAFEPVDNEWYDVWAEQYSIATLRAELLPYRHALESTAAN